MVFVELLQELSDDDRLLESIRFVCLDRDGEEIMDAYLSRGGIARLYDGDTEGFMRSFVDPIREHSLSKYDEMSDHSKTEQLPAGRPFTIQFDDSLLTERSQLERLCDVLAKMDNASVSVFHLNPHLHIGVLDYSATSALDIYMTGPSSLRVIPSHRTLQAFLVRVCNTIFAQYGEGEVVS